MQQIQNPRFFAGYSRHNGQKALGGPGFQHGSPPVALVAYLLEAGAKDLDYPLSGAGRFARMSENILSAAPMGELVGHTRLTRPGKRIAHFETIISDTNSREVIRGHGWWIKTSDTEEIRREVGPIIPGPQEGTTNESFAQRWQSRYIDSIEVRQVDAPVVNYPLRDQGNPLIAWARSDYPVMAGEADTPWTGLMKTVDITNGLNAVLDPQEWGFMDVDLGVYLHRLPVRGWTDLWAEHNYGIDGIGTTIA